MHAIIYHVLHKEMTFSDQFLVTRKADSSQHSSNLDTVDGDSKRGWKEQKRKRNKYAHCIFFEL